ncbi:hypothetical protein LTR36_002968 [Oleoguttula mirabilis]|uniref:Sedoheptulose-1,7-bisphosphatase n=1 Tax=Oleoguttula mirabilis TaxID=1507867 RepID=A0AAV9JY26_9PEZI|nr:hypothetical protein LTR36_002968 [Oleoguttula mirabilis]
MERYSNVVAHIQSVLPPDTRPSLSRSVIPTIIHCIDGIAQALRTSHQVSLAGTANSFGDDQLNVDVLAERIIRDEIAKCPSIATASSEEEPTERPSRETESAAHSESSEVYTLAFDPLDGSSIIAPNWTVGTIVGIWDGASALHQTPSEKQIAAILGVYGPRTTAIIAIRVPGSTPTCFEVGLGGKDGEATCEIVRSKVELLSPPFKTRYFAPANLRAAAEDEKYMKLVTHYIQQKYTLRYSGGLVPDVVHMLVKGHGIYVSPVTTTSKAKLRRLYELTPIALIMECAGASAVDPVTGKGILEEPVGDCDERGGLICGTADEVSFVLRSFGLQ